MEDIEIIKVIGDGYLRLFNDPVNDIVALPRSGSDRRYYRICLHDHSVIGTYNANYEENEAFVGFSKHFLAGALPVPEIFGYLPDEYVYYQRDLGDVNLYTWIHARDAGSFFDEETMSLYRKVLDRLILFQAKGIKGLNLDLCYPHKSFDRQSMMWDMNYFKYMFLKLLTVPFNERRLEHDFNSLADYLLETGQEYFLYRDFQTANVMVLNQEPWFIDYQGGRKGAPQYDVASLLYDAKIPMPEDNREKLLNYYIDNFCSESKEDKYKFRGHYSGFSMIRLMQALGAFGFRGLYERKPTFTESIVPGVRLLQQVIAPAESHINLPELYSTIKAIPESALFIKLAESKH